MNLAGRPTKQHKRTSLARFVDSVATLNLRDAMLNTENLNSPSNFHRSFNMKTQRGRRLTMAEENTIRGQIRRGEDPNKVCEEWGIKIQRLRRVNGGPLYRMGAAIEAIQRR